MPWGTPEYSQEVFDYLADLTADAAATVRFHIDRLAEFGPALGKPHIDSLGDKLMELRFHLNRAQVRITFCVATGRRIVFLTVFPKTKPREQREIARARRAMNDHKNSATSN